MLDIAQFLYLLLSLFFLSLRGGHRWQASFAEDWVPKVVKYSTTQ